MLLLCYTVSMRLFLVVLSTFIVSISTVFAQGQPDVFLDTVHHVHQPQIQILKNKNIVQGYGYGIFRPDILINRAEFLKILMTARYGGTQLVGNELRCFADFIGDEQWFWPSACLAKELGIIKGYPDGTFRGGQSINLAEAIKIIAVAYTLPTAAAPTMADLWYVPYFTIANDRGLFEYFPYQAGHLLTRSEMAYAIVKMNVPLADPLADTLAISSVTSTSSVSESYDFLRPVCGDGNIQVGETCDDGNLQNGDGCSDICILEYIAPVVSSAAESSISVPPISSFSSSVSSASSVSSISSTSVQSNSSTSTAGPDPFGLDEFNLDDLDPYYEYSN